MFLRATTAGFTTRLPRGQRTLHVKLTIQDNLVTPGVPWLLHPWRGSQVSDTGPLGLCIAATANITNKATSFKRSQREDL